MKGWTKKMEMLAVNASVSNEYETEEGNCEDNEAEIGDRNAEQQ